MLEVVAQFWSSDVYEIGSSLLSIAERLWWVWLFLLLAWFLRWYGMARDAGVENPGIRGLTLWFSDLFRTGRQTLVIVGGLVAVLLGFLGFALNIIPTAFAGIAGGDPLTIAVVLSMAASLFTPFDEYVFGEHVMTPGLVLLVLAGAFVAVMALEAAAEYVNEQND
jgi:hypothetical protein